MTADKPTDAPAFHSSRAHGSGWFGPGKLPTTRFILFGGDRCGKSILVELLLQYGLVVCDRNLLANRCFFPLWHLHRQALRSQVDLYGFQLSSNDVLEGQRLREPSDFLQLLHQQGYCIIHLHRQDIMRHAVALLKAQQPLAVPTLKRQPIEIPPDALLAQLAQLEQQRLEETAILAPVPHLRITYETDLLDPNQHPQTTQRLSEFLGESWSSQPRINLRLVHHQIADLIANYDEVRQALEQSDYAYVLSARSMQLVI
ncbi:MAG: hypothetical protein AAFU71_04730 [Cyanobacteria bacterium J06632_22]